MESFNSRKIFLMTLSFERIFEGKRLNRARNKACNAMQPKEQARRFIMRVETEFFSVALSQALRFNKLGGVIGKSYRMEPPQPSGNEWRESVVEYFHALEIAVSRLW